MSISTPDSTVLPEPSVPARKPRPEMPSPEEVLVPKLSQAWALTRGQMLLVASACLFFMYYNYLKLFHSDFWGHVSYGQWMLEHRELPAQEIFVELARGVPVVCTAWLSQLLLALLGRTGDVEVFSHTFAITATAAYFALGMAFYLQTRNATAAFMAGAVAWVLAWSRHAIIRPEMFGTLCFGVLCLLMVAADSARRRRPEDQSEPLSRGPAIAWYAGMFALFMLWANLHGSYIVGFGVLGAYVLGRAIDVAWKTRDLLACLSDRLFQQRLIAAEAAFLGTLINPYGMDLLVHTLVFPSNPNLKDVWEWFPLEAVSLEGPFIALSIVLMLVLFRHSRARISASDVILLGLFGLAVAVRVRMIAWYAPVVALVLAPHIGDVLARVTASLRRDPEIEPVFQWLEIRSHHQTLITLLIVWIAFCFSPASRPVLGGKPRDLKHVYSADTPRTVSEYLREHPPVGLVANPQWWGDWLAYDGPPEIRLLMTTNSVHVVPPTVWQDYLEISKGADGLERRLDRYRINTVIVCKALQKNLLQVIQELNGWEVIFDDDIGLIAVRSSTRPATAPVADTSTAADGTADGTTDGTTDETGAALSPADPVSEPPATDTPSAGGQSSEPVPVTVPAEQSTPSGTGKSDASETSIPESP